MERPSDLYHAAALTHQIGALVEKHKDVHRGLERTGTLAQGLQRQLQKIPRGVEPDTLKPISAVLGTTHELVEGLTGLRANRHGYFHGSWYRQQLDTMERRLGLLSEILESELTRGLGTPDDDEPTLHHIIADQLAQEFWRVAFGRNVVEVPAGQFFACVERIIDGDDWLDFACLSQALDPKRSGRIEISRFADFVEAENGLVRGLHKYATAPTAVYACGSNRMGECGQAALVQDHLEHPTLLKVLADRTVRQVDCDSGSSAALLANGDLYSWGSNSCGKLGHGDVSGTDEASGSCGAPRLIQAFQGIPMRQVSCGTTFMAAVAEDGRLFTWGGYGTHARHDRGHAPTLGHDPNTPGLRMQRGPGDTPFLSLPAQVASLEMPVSQVACGTEHAAAITVEGRLYCWGGGERGRLGIGNEDDYHTPQLVSVLEEKAICQVSCGTFHTLALTTDGMIYAWGSGKDGKLGLGDVAYCPFFERDAAGQPFVSKPQLLSAIANVPIVQLSAGSAHSAVVSEAGAVYTFGCGKCGKLGHGGTSAEWLPKRVEGTRGADATQVSCGRDHTAAVTSRGELLTWGHGERGRLGNGNSSGVEAKPRAIHGMRGGALQVQCGRFHTLIMAGEQQMSEHEFDTLERMLEDRLGMREAEGKAAMERYRTTTGKKRRRRRHVNRLGQEEYLSETETEQSELDLAPDVQRLIVEESEMYAPQDTAPGVLRVVTYPHETQTLLLPVVPVDRALLAAYDCITTRLRDAGCEQVQREDGRVRGTERGADRAEITDGRDATADASNTP
jgi:alpha-tubulin suppressor-like RCC1 family protein